jgi:hypothetical protein
MSKAGTTPELSKEPIPYKVLQSAKFAVKRPDVDGSLNYPGYLATNKSFGFLRYSYEKSRAL